MTLSGGLRVDSSDGRVSVNLRFEVSDEDERVLREFADDASRLFRSLDAMGGIRVGLDIAVTLGEPAKTNVTEPTDDQRAIILHRLRPLVLTKEPWSFDRTCAALSRTTSHPFMNEHLRRIRDVYTGRDIQRQVVISRGGLILNGDVAFQHWLNGFEYHRDSARAAEFAPLGDLLPFEATRAVVLDLLAEKLKAIGMVLHITSAILGKGEAEPSA